MKQTLLIMIGIITFVGVLTGLKALGYAFFYTDTVVERAVLKNSFQYKEGMAQRGAILEANIMEIDAQLNTSPDNRASLLTQKRILEAQLRAITINN